MIDERTNLSIADQRAIQAASEEEKAIFKATGLFGGNQKAIEYLQQYKNRLDRHYQAIQRNTPKFSQSALNQAKQEIFEYFPNSIAGQYGDLNMLGNNPDELLINYRDYIIAVLDKNPTDGMYSLFNDTVQKWKADLKAGKVSKDDPDTFFIYARDSILSNPNNITINLSDIKYVFGIDLYQFVPKDNSSHISYKEKSIKGKITSLDPNSDEYKQILDSYSNNQSTQIATYNKNTNSFESTIFNNNYAIKGIYKIEGLPGEDKFQSIKNSHATYKDKNYGGKNGYSDIFFHGTPIDSSFQILGDSGEFKQGLVGNGSALGLGLYVTDNIATALKYTVQRDPFDESASKEQVGGEGRGTNYVGSVMLCEGSLGNCEFGTHVRNFSQTYISTHLDSAGLPPINWPNTEWKFNDPNAAIPRYVIEVEVTPLSKKRKR